MEIARSAFLNDLLVTSCHCHSLSSCLASHGRVQFPQLQAKTRNMKLAVLTMASWSQLLQLNACGLSSFVFTRVVLFAISFFSFFPFCCLLDVWWQAATDEHLAHISMMRCSQHGQFGCCIDLALPDPLTHVTSCHLLWPLVTFRSGTSTTFFIRLLDRETKEKATCLIWSAFTSW